MRRRLRSLRTNALLAVLAVVLSPLAFVLVSNGLETLFAGKVLQRCLRAASEVAALPPGTSSQTLAERVAGLAARDRTRIRVVSPSGQVLADADQMITDTALFRLGDLLYGPDRKPVLARASDTPPPSERADVLRARNDGTSAGCEHFTAGNLDYCAAAQRMDEEGRVVLVEGMSRRALQALYESRRQLAKLTLVVLGLGLVLGWLLGRRMVRPIEVLRDQILARAAAAAPRADIDLQRHDEVGDLATSFNALLNALAERNRANETFLADLAHEFKNPVAAVRAAAERLKDEGAQEPARAQRLADVLMTSAVRLDALLTQFLELARAESGLPNERREDVDLLALLRGLVDALRGDVRYPHVTTELECPPGRAVAHGVASRLESAFRNLLDNGAFFAGEGGRLRVSARAVGGELEVAIQDSGPGIPAADLPRIFERFFTTRGDRHGTGLGLALTRAVVEAHGGRIHAECPPDSGARFVTRLPVTWASFDPPG
jgi:signal transduction histidine kinase